MSKAFKLKVLSFTLFFYFNEGHRIHVHIAHKDGREIKIWMDDFSVARSTFKKADEADLIKLARKYEEEIRREWKKTFGKKTEE